MLNRESHEKGKAIAKWPSEMASFHGNRHPPLTPQQPKQFWNMPGDRASYITSKGKDPLGCRSRRPQVGMQCQD